MNDSPRLPKQKNGQVGRHSVSMSRRFTKNHWPASRAGLVKTPRFDWSAFAFRTRQAAHKHRIWWIQILD
jgi:hypothetical protein